MALQTIACAVCGHESSVNLPEDGIATAWECTKTGCSARNDVPGNPIPAEVIIAPSERDEEGIVDAGEVAAEAVATTADVVGVADHDLATSGDTN